MNGRQRHRPALGARHFLKRMDISNSAERDGPQQQCALQMQLRQPHVGIGCDRAV